VKIRFALRRSSTDILGRLDPLREVEEVEVTSPAAVAAAAAGTDPRPAHETSDFNTSTRHSSDWRFK